MHTSANSRLQYRRFFFFLITGYGPQSLKSINTEHPTGSLLYSKSTIFYLILVSEHKDLFGDLTLDDEKDPVVLDDEKDPVVSDGKSVKG